MVDEYRTFEELATRHSEGTDYHVEYLDRGSHVVVLAPHGGGIEPYTSPVARLIAQDDLSYYTFRGTIPGGGNGILHITSGPFLKLRWHGHGAWDHCSAS